MVAEDPCNRAIRATLLIREFKNTAVPVRLIIDIMVDVEIAIVSLIAGGTFLYLGIRDYRAMANARAEWTQISDLASGTGSGDVQASEPVQFIEIPAGASEDEFLAISNQAVYKPDDILYKSIDLAALQSLNPNVTGYIPVTPDAEIQKRPAGDQRHDGQPCHDFDHIVRITDPAPDFLRSG